MVTKGDRYDLDCAVLDVRQQRDQHASVEARWIR
jgi:hypothetical protein